MVATRLIFLCAISLPLLSFAAPLERRKINNDLDAYALALEIFSRNSFITREMLENCQTIDPNQLASLPDDDLLEILDLIDYWRSKRNGTSTGFLPQPAKFFLETKFRVARPTAGTEPTEPTQGN
ncbi:MAG: hypothetical protein LBB14_03385 [Puniceicoccales bacterium]|jgi:hypothetical protein|nr:hypothetical protein [Puniceicoccales bacterium]